MQCSHNFCNLRYNSKITTSFFFLHSFRNRRFVLTEDLSNLSVWFFFSFLKLSTFTFSLKKSTLQLFFGTSRLPVSLFLSFGALENNHWNTMTTGLKTKIATKWLRDVICWTKGCFMSLAALPKIPSLRMTCDLKLTNCLLQNFHLMFSALDWPQFAKPWIWGESCSHWMELYVLFP